MRFAPGLLGKQLTPTRTSRPSQRGKPYDVGWDVDRAVREGLERVTWVFRSVNAIADAWAGLPVIQRQDDKQTGTVIENPHEVVGLLNGFPNDNEEAEHFRHRMASQLLLSKRGAFVEVLRFPRTGEIGGLALLPPGRTKPIPGSRGEFLQGFEVTISATEKIRLPRERVAWVRRPHPTDPYASQTPLEAAGLAVDTDFLARLYARNYVRNDARPSMLVVFKGEVTKEDEEELMSRFSGGPSVAGRIGFVGTEVLDGEGNAMGPGAGADVIDFSKSPRDAEWVKLRELTKDEILGAYAVPESVATGKASERTFANADAERVMFFQTTVPYNVRHLLAPLDRLDPDPTRFLAVDYSLVPEFQTLERERRKMGLEELKAGGITIDEFRDEYLGRGSVPGGGVIRLPLTMQPIGSGRPERSERALPEPSMKAPDLEGFRRAAEARLTSWEGHVNQVMTSFFSRQRRVVLAKLRAASTLRGTRHWEGKGTDHKGTGDKQVDPSAVFDRAMWDREIVEVAEPFQEAIVADAGQDVGERLTHLERAARNGEAKQDEGFEFELSDPRVQRFLTVARNRLRGVNDTTWKAIRQQLLEGEAAGESIAQLEKRIRTVFDATKARAVRIARTEVVAARGAGGLEGARQSGAVDGHRWLSVLDDRTRETHLDADGQTVGIDEPFILSSGAELMHPGDPNAPGDELVNCRCDQLWTKDGEVIG